MADDVKDTIDRAATTAKAAADKTAKAAKSTTDAFRDGASKAREGFSEHVVDPAKRAGEAMKASGEKIAEGGATIGKTMIDQAEQNAREAFAAMRESANAKDMAEVMRIQGEYLREQGQRSMTQAREIGELIMRFGRDAVTPLKHK